jgi:dipeptidyl aminopeptidase/acylaminoacyl peptidase
MRKAPFFGKSDPRLIQSACFVGLVVLALVAGPATRALAATESANQSASGYNLPPKAILDVMRAPMVPTPVVSPTHDRLILKTLQLYPSIERVSTPILKLAGVRAEVRNHSKHDTQGGYGVVLCATNLELVQVSDQSSHRIEVPGSMCADTPVWNADGSRFAFENTTADAVELWIGDGKTGAVRKVANARLNQLYGEALQWMPDQKTLLVRLVPEHLGPPPAETTVPTGPSIQESDGQSGESSTYEIRDTLKNHHDEDLFDYYATSQIALVDSQTLKVTPLGKPARVETLDAAPDGRHILVSTMHKPYSYVTTYDNFPQEVAVWDIEDRTSPKAHTIVDLPLFDRVPIRGVPVGPREFEWRSTEPASLVWKEALDGGDLKVTVPDRDKLMEQKAPFTAPAHELTRTQQRLIGLLFSKDAAATMLIEDDENRHWTKISLFNANDPSQAQKVLWDMSSDEKYGNPGQPVIDRLPNGSPVMRLDGDHIFMFGVGSSPDGDRPFLDRYNLKTAQSERLFRSRSDAYERFLGFIGDDNRSFLTWHQTIQDPPNAFLRTLGASEPAAEGEAAFSSDAKVITHVTDPTPQIRSIKKRLVKYKRADGVDLSFTLLTPPGYQEGTRVPTILYAYPLDYAQASTASQHTGSQQTFTFLYEYRLLLLAGYAILDNTSFPVIGDPKRAYDNFIEQLQADAKAAVDEGVRIGVVDPDRVGVTGHSHGALMTANLVAHTDLFRAGIATSGSYNKTLTPFGFQSERRSVWAATDVYLKASPFFIADKIKTPLLLIHGADDANPGTTPLQSQKLFEAIRGNGGTTRLVMLPHEPHWYTALESNEQLMYEMVRWFDMYVKNAPPRSEAPAASDAAPASKP